MAVVTPELSGGARGRRRVARVLQLIGLVPAVVVAVADEVVRHTAAVLTGELVLLTRLVGAALLVAAVPAVVAAVTPDFRQQAAKDFVRLPDGQMTDVMNGVEVFIFLTCRSCGCRGHCYS